MIKSKYDKEYKKFRRDHHRRTRSQIEKIDKIIQDATDLNEILIDPNQWLSKN